MKHLVNSRRILLLSLLLSAVLCIQTAAAQPYMDYEYSSDNYNGLIYSKQETANAKPSPAAFVYDTSLNSHLLNLKVPLNTPEDFASDQQGNVYILDTLNARIVVVDSTLTHTLCILRGWTTDKSKATGFTDGRGMFIRGNRVYVCLTSPGEIVAFDIPKIITSEKALTSEKPEELNVPAIRVISAPNVSAIMNTFDFKPTKVVVDRSERLYVVVEGIYDGLMMIDSDNTFVGFVGANRIKISALDLFWRSLSTDAQIEAQKDVVPIEFNSLDMDDNGFIYTTAKGTDSESLVRRINLIGNDVLKRGTTYIKGELSPLYDKGNPGTLSNLVDIDVTDSGLYTCLDNARGKIFTYNSEGDLLFVFGGLSAQRGAFNVPNSVMWIGDKLLVLDKGDNEVVVFHPTEYGSAILKASRAQYAGGYGESWKLWNEVIALNPYNQTAQKNVGKLQYDQGNYELAMQHFQLGDSPDLYSKAFAKYRKLQAEKWIPWIAAVLLLGFGVLVIMRFIKMLRESRARWRFFLEEVRKYRARNRKIK